jgi:glucose/mannose transport system substrate-binding protein
MGHTWTDVAIPHDTGSNVSLINLVTGGNPPNVFIESSPGFYRDLAGMGLARPLTDFYEEEGYLEHLPAAAVQSITVDGEIMKIPTAIHIDGMVYYNMDVAEAAGVDPTAWTSLEQMFADFEKVSAAGYNPLAIGGEQWQVGYLAHALAAAVGGPEFFTRSMAKSRIPQRWIAPRCARCWTGSAASSRPPTRVRSAGHGTRRPIWSSP